MDPCPSGRVIPVRLDELGHGSLIPPGDEIELLSISILLYCVVIFVDVGLQLTIVSPICMQSLLTNNRSGGSTSR
jgi:hypothetical protein